MFDVLVLVMNGGYKLGIGHHALDVLKDLCDRANRHDGERLTAFPSHAGIAERIMISKSSVQRGIIELQEAGYIVVNHQYTREGYSTNEYEINEALIRERITAYVKPERKPKEPALLSSQPVYDNNEPEAQKIPEGFAIDENGVMYETVEHQFMVSEQKEQAIDRKEQDTIAHNAVASASYCIAGPEPENYELFDRKPAEQPEPAPVINRGQRAPIISDSTRPQPIGTTPGWGERVWTGVTKQVCSPGSKRDDIYEVLGLLWPKYGSEEALIEYLTPFWQAWNSRRGKTGAAYSPTNPAWLTEWVAAGAIPENTKEQEPAHKPKSRVW